MTERREYRVNDYSAYNNAVTSELNHHREIAESVRQESILRKAKVAVFISGAIAILAVAIALIYLILSNVNSSPSMAPSQVQSAVEAQNLGTISRSEGAPEFGITKAFNVFDSTPISTGEIVVTAKEYSPNNLAVPEYQYCYLTSSASITNVQQIELAEINPDTGELVVKTEDAFLIDSALPYCSFVNHSDK